MNDKEFDLLIFIGRFQPFHTEHKRVIDIALEKSHKVLILIGSAGTARTIRNPFTFQERSWMIHNSFVHLDLDEANDYRGAPASSRLIIKPLYDKTYNDNAWIAQVQQTVKAAILYSINQGGFGVSGTSDARVGLIGASKDHTSYYLKMFPQFSSVDVTIDNPLHATYIRERYLDGSAQKYTEHTSILPRSVADFMFDDFIHSEAYKNLQDELLFVRGYKKQWTAAPYPVKHVTVDAVVEQGGHILLIRRRSSPGKGLWALPGGHLNEYEPIMTGIIRELKEETKIKVPEAVLRGSVETVQVFDDPHRSTLGRVITHAAHIKLVGDVKLPKIVGSDDADKAAWVPIANLSESELFDDHFHIIKFFLGAS